MNTALGLRVAGGYASTDASGAGVAPWSCRAAELPPRLDRAGPPGVWRRLPGGRPALRLRVRKVGVGSQAVGCLPGSRPPAGPRRGCPAAWRV